MYKKVIKYEDFDGNEREEEFYFNLTKAEVMMWLTTNSDYTLDQLLMRLAEERNGKKIMEIFEDLILSSYGVKSLDGKEFIKTEEIRRKFKSTEAYSELFMELVTDAQKAAAFINAIIPKSLADSVDEVLEKYPNGIPDNLADYTKGRVTPPSRN